MKQILFVVTLICVCLFSQGAVLGIFESKNFPAGITGSGDGVCRLEIIDNELYAATEKGISNIQKLKTRGTAGDWKILMCLISKSVEMKSWR